MDRHLLGIYGLNEFVRTGMDRLINCDYESVQQPAPPLATGASWLTKKHHNFSTRPEWQDCSQPAVSQEPHWFCNLF